MCTEANHFMTVLFTPRYHFRKYEDEQILENLHCFLTPTLFFLKLNKCCQQPCYIASLHSSTFHACMHDFISDYVLIVG